MSQRTEDDQARDLLADLKSRGFRLCEYVDGGDYLSGYKEWSPIDDARAIKLIAMLLLCEARR